MDVHRVMRLAKKAGRTMSEAADEAGSVEGHSHHDEAEAPRHHRSRVRWIVAYVVGLAAIAAALFVFVPGGGPLALFILLGGLMVLHHLPGGMHQHGG